MSAPDAGRPVKGASFAPPARSNPGTSATAPAVSRLAGEAFLPERTVPRAELAEWRERYGLVAGLTVRGDNGGFSLGLATEDPVGQVMGRWRAFLHAVRPAFPAVQLGRQVHSATVSWHEGVAPGWHVAEELDGHATGNIDELHRLLIEDRLRVSVPMVVLRRELKLTLPVVPREIPPAA